MDNFWSDFHIVSKCFIAGSVFALFMLSVHFAPEIVIWFVSKFKKEDE